MRKFAGCFVSEFVDTLKDIERSFNINHTRKIVKRTLKSFHGVMTMYFVECFNEIITILIANESEVGQVQVPQVKVLYLYFTNMDLYLYLYFEQSTWYLYLYFEKSTWYLYLYFGQILLYLYLSTKTCTLLYLRHK